MNTSLNNLADKILNTNEAAPPIAPESLNTEGVGVETKEPKKEKPAKFKSEKNNFERIEEFLLSEYEFRLNEIQVELEYKHADSEEWEVLNENNLFYRLYKAGFKSFEHIVKTLLKNDFTRKKFNPIRYYFENLPPYDSEKEPDYIQQMSEFVIVAEEQKQAWQSHFKKALVRSIACSLRKIKFNKQCIVLRGKQNDGKSMFVRNLNPFPPAYFTDAFNPEQKDDVKRLATCFMINIDEMADLGRRDINLIKSKMTFENVKMRLPYDAKDSDLPRIANFWATTNETQFLTDVTGSVRWVIFDIESIKHDNGGKNGYMSIDIHKVWSQAYHLFKTGYDFKLSDSELKESEEKNRQYQSLSKEYEYITRYFEVPKDGEEHEVMYRTEIIEYIQAQHRGLQLNEFHISKALKFYKFEIGKKYNAAKKYTESGYKVVKINVVKETDPAQELKKLKDQYIKMKLANSPNLASVETKIKELETKVIEKALQSQTEITEYPAEWD